MYRILARERSSEVKYWKNGEEEKSPRERPKIRRREMKKKLKR